MDVGFLAGMCALLRRGVARSLLRTWAFEQLGGCFFPSVVWTPVFDVWRHGSIFPRGGVLSHEGVCFPMCRVRFFCRPGHMLAPSKNFCGDLCPRILFPHAFSHLLPPPTPWRPWKWCVHKQRPLATGRRRVVPGK